MKIESIKSNLRQYYNLEAEHRSAREKDGWKVKQRDIFHRILAGEDKRTLLELGAGTGQDSRFFMDCGLEVTAVDLSAEMVKQCRQRGIDAYEMDFYDLADLNRKFDCVWAMNCLLHVPKPDLPRVLRNIDRLLSEDGLFYMGVYGGRDTEDEWADRFSEIPRFFAAYTEESIKKVLQDVFAIVSFEQIDKDDIGSGIDFQSIIVRKK